ncbi:MAG: dehydrogenase, partial [Mycobacterium sp.]
MPGSTHPHYPDQTRFAFRPGVTCVTTPAGAVLLNPPDSQKLPRLTAGQLRALKTLNLGPANLPGLSGKSEISSPASDIATLIAHLTAGGWLTVTVRDTEQDRYSILPFGRPPPRPAPSQSAVLSKFTVLHRDSEGLVLEHPRGWCDVRIHDARLLVLLDDPETDPATDGPELPAATAAVASRFVEDLHWSGMLVAIGAEDRSFDAVSWSAPDLWFLRRSTLGERTVTWEHFGPTKWAKGRFPQPPPRGTNYPGEPIVLPVPDLAARRAQDPTLTAVLEDRLSTRTFDDAHPITIEQ